MGGKSVTTPITTLKAQSINAGSIGFDCLIPPSDWSSYADQFNFYVGYTQQMTENDLGYALQSGLGVMLVQGYYDDMVSNQSGASWGQTAVDQAESIGYLKGCVLWLDLENVTQSSSKTIIWCNEWAAVVSNAGYIPGLYVGVPQPLSSLQLYRLNFSHYWKSESSDTENVATRGYQMFQSADGDIDEDEVEVDNEGGLPIAEYQVNYS